MVSNKEKLWSGAWRWAKTLFFVANMLASLFFVCAPQLLVVLLDLFLPFVLFAPAAGVLSVQLRSYQFGTSLIDLPLLSAARSILLLCFYLCWSGSGAYFGVATLCAAASAGYVSLKAIAMFGAEAATARRHLLSLGKDGPAVEALFLCSLSLAMAHVAVAYRTSCRERRKQLVYKIDIEAVSVYNTDFSNYHKMALS